MKSTKFVTACYILSFVAYHRPALLTTPTIARWVNTNASRVRQIVAKRLSDVPWADAATNIVVGMFLKRVIAEMGGKNAIIVDDDANLDEAVQAELGSSDGGSSPDP